MLPPIARDLGNEVLHLRVQPVCGAPKFAGAAAASRIVHIEPDAILHSERHGDQLIVVLWGAYDSDRFGRGDLPDVSESGFKTFKGASPQGVTFFTAISPIPQSASPKFWRRNGDILGISTRYA